MVQAVLSLSPKVPKDIRKMGAKVKNLARQLPFATSLALNDTAFDVRHSSVDLFNRSFQVRNKRFASTAFRVERSNKRTLTARIYDRLGRDWLKRQAKGGIKRARASKLLIPVAAKRTGRGTRDPRSYKKTFAATINGKPGIWQRHGRGGKKLKMLFLFKSSVRVDKGFDFYRNAAKVARQKMPINNAKAWRRAIATARLK